MKTRNYTLTDKNGRSAKIAAPNLAEARELAAKKLKAHPGSFTVINHCGHCDKACMMFQYCNSVCYFAENPYLKDGSK